MERGERRTPGNDALDRVFAGAIGARVFARHLANLDDFEPEVRDAVLKGKKNELPLDARKRLEPRDETLLYHRDAEGPRRPPELPDGWSVGFPLYVYRWPGPRGERTRGRKSTDHPPPRTVDPMGRFETRGTGAFGERGRRKVSVFAEDDGRFWVIFFEDGTNRGDLRVATTPEAVAAARKWLEE